MFVMLFKSVNPIIAIHDNYIDSLKVVSILVLYCDTAMHQCIIPSLLMTICFIVRNESNTRHVYKSAQHYHIKPQRCQSGSNFWKKLETSLLKHTVSTETMVVGHFIGNINW